MDKVRRKSLFHSQKNKTGRGEGLIKSILLKEHIVLLIAYFQINRQFLSQRIGLVVQALSFFHCVHRVTQMG